MQNRWQVQEAKGRFSEVIAKAERSGPQFITKHGREVAVLLSAGAYERLARRPNSTLVEFLSHSGLSSLELPDRDPADTTREVTF